MGKLIQTCQHVEVSPSGCSEVNADLDTVSLDMSFFFRIHRVNLLRHMFTGTGNLRQVFLRFITIANNFILYFDLLTENTCFILTFCVIPKIESSILQLSIQLMLAVSFNLQALCEIMIPFEKKYYVLELKEVVLVGQILFLELVLSDILPAE